MDADFLLHTINAITPLSSALQDRFRSYLVEEHFHKRDYLLEQGKTCRRIFFIKSGFARAFYLSPAGKECTTWFMGTGDLMISVYSFFCQKPAHEWIEILEDSTLQSISYQQLQSVYAEFPEGNLIGRVMTEKYYLLSEARAILLRTTTPEERYLKLMETHPNILEKATLKQVACYLGITQETLCRLRAKLPKLTQSNLKPV